MSKKMFIVSIFIQLILIITIVKTTEPKINNLTNERLEVISTKSKELPIAKLIIPKIKLDGIIYDKNSNLNNVDKNITILNKSILPNKDKSIIFLTANSGSGPTAYFNDLDKLKSNDIIIFQFKNYSYYYKIDKIFEEEKNGNIEILKTSNNQLVLTTCSKNNRKKQLIINSNQIKKEEIT